MTIIDIFSIRVGSAIILTLLGSIALDGIRRRRLTNKKKIIPTIDNKWQKIKVQA
jgi:hypothetical protein